MNNNSKKNNSTLAKFSFIHKPGFTIIEVIIVLVVGAVIMLAVFLVVPQLQISQRNSSRASEARRVLAAMNQFSAEGKTYATVSGVDYNNVPACTGTMGGTPTTELNYITGDLRRPESTTPFALSIRSCVPTNSGGKITSNDLGRLFIINGSKCNNGILEVQANSNSVNYPVEPIGVSNYKTVCIGN